MSIEVRAEVLPREAAELSIEQCGTLRDLGQYLLDVDCGTRISAAYCEVRKALSAIENGQAEDGSRRIRVTLEMSDEDADGIYGTVINGIIADAVRVLGMPIDGCTIGLEAFRARQLEGEPMDEGPTRKRHTSVGGYWVMEGAEKSRRLFCHHTDGTVTELERLPPAGLEAFNDGPLEAEPEGPESRRERAIRNLTELRERNGLCGGLDVSEDYDNCFFGGVSGVTGLAPLLGYHPLGWFADMGGEA